MKPLVLLILSGIISFHALSQDHAPDQIVLAVDTMKITRGEFLYALNKNNYSHEKITRKDVEDYLNLYINFKLKVRDAYANGYDTTHSFLREFNLYKKQLDDSYLKNDAWLDSLTRLVYDRMESVVRVSHILISIHDPLNPSDTLAAWKKINRVYPLAISGIPFSKLAAEYSEDPSAAYNGGDLGYFTALQVESSFENAAYNTPVGHVSQPFRTKYGYHILKVTDKKPNPGTVEVAHIMIRFAAGMTEADSLKVKQKAEDLYSRLVNGEDWDKLCADFSQDYNTKNSGGRLPTFGVGRMVPPFADAAFSLKIPGEICRPVETPYGWHIIKLIGKHPLQSFDEIKPGLREKVKQADRYKWVQERFIDQLAREDQFVSDPHVFQQCQSLADSQLVEGKWKVHADWTLLNDRIASINSKPYSVRDFFDYIIKNQKPVRGPDPASYMDILFSSFRESILLGYEESHLADKYPDYRWLVKEYKEGILMFDRMDTMVWKNTALDSTGIQEFFNRNREKYKYGEKADVTMISSNNDSVLREIGELIQEKYYPYDRHLFHFTLPLNARARGAIDSLYHTAETRYPDLYLSVKGSGIGLEYFKDSIVAAKQYHPASIVYGEKGIGDTLDFRLVTSSKKMLTGLYSGNPELFLRIDSGKYEKGTNDILNRIDWKPGKYYLSLEDTDYIVFIHKIDPPDQKSLEDARGDVTADYQKNLEEQWVDELKRKYQVMVNKKVIKEIIHKLEV